MYRLVVKRQAVRSAVNKYADQKLSAPETVAKIAAELLRAEDQEVFLVFFLDIKNRFLSYSEVSRGGVDFCPVDPRIVFRAALLTPSCASIILCHNHPSDDPTPSQDDCARTKRLTDLGKLLGLPVLDHVIVTDKKHYSLAEKGTP